MMIMRPRSEPPFALRACLHDTAPRWSPTTGTFHHSTSEETEFMTLPGSIPPAPPENPTVAVAHSPAVSPAPAASPNGSPHPRASHLPSARRKKRSLRFLVAAILVLLVATASVVYFVWFRGPS